MEHFKMDSGLCAASYLLYASWITNPVDVVPEEHLWGVGCFSRIQQPYKDWHTVATQIVLIQRQGIQHHEHFYCLQQLKIDFRVVVEQQMQVAGAIFIAVKLWQSVNLSHTTQPTVSELCIQPNWCKTHTKTVQIVLNTVFLFTYTVPTAQQWVKQLYT